MNTRQITPTKPARRKVQSLEREIEKCKANIAKERDKLREMTGELIDLKECCDEAIEDLTRATDALSRLV